MEADWSVEIGAGLPLVVVPWEGFVNLRSSPALASALPEAAASPILKQWLITLNKEASPVFTSKCDIWPLTANEIDPLEFDATREDAKQGIVCYVDIIAREASLFASFSAHESWVSLVTEKLRQAKLQQALAELIVRQAIVNDQDGYAVTLYVSACGANVNDAECVFDAALEIAAAITMNLATKGE